MIEDIEEVQARLQGMRDALLKEGSVYPEEDHMVTRPEVTKKVLWYLDLLASAVAGAHRHISNMMQDDIYSDSEKDELKKTVVERLEKELGVLPDVIKDYYYCLGRHFRYLDTERYQSTSSGDSREELLEKRKIVEEVLGQLELLDREIDDMVGLLLAP